MSQTINYKTFNISAMANSLIKGVGILAMAALATPAASAQDNAVKVQNYTSSITVSTLDNHGIVQQVASPLGYPLKIGEDVISQGLFGILTELDKSTTGVGEIAYSQNDGIALAFDQVLNILTVNASVDAGAVRIAVIDTAGTNVFAETYDDAECIVELPHLTPGIYIAAAATSNNFYKSIKFTVK